MKQVQISKTQESETVTIEVRSKPDAKGKTEVLHSENLPGLNGNTATVLGFNERQGETVLIF